MFSAIAPTYDLLNRLLSCGQDIYWRKAAVDRLEPASGQELLDVATGTGDVALEIGRRMPGALQVIGVDFSLPMLERAKVKILRRGLEKTVRLEQGCGENLPFRNNRFDGVTCAFGIRNYGNVVLGLREMYRVLRGEGKVVILEFSLPSNSLLRSLYTFYFERVLPGLGKIVSRHDTAYSYLPRSVSGFPSRDGFAKMMEETGFENVAYRDLTFGIVTLYSGIKNEA